MPISGSDGLKSTSPFSLATSSASCVSALALKPSVSNTKNKNNTYCQIQDQMVEPQTTLKTFEGKNPLIINTA